MDVGSSDLNGFVASCVSHDPGIQVRIPGLAVKHYGLKAGDLLELTIRNKDGDSVEVSRKVQKSGSNHKFYLPKDKREELSLESPDTVQVFFRKK
jgi:bifunctional DNA-binding transcriptional regulator/antitoxin component of YhaV-PrlF toxin-antitoxin module